MALSRKNYVAVAQIVADSFENASEAGDTVGPAEGISEVAGRLADYFASDNPNFDRDRFLKACGVTA